MTFDEKREQLQSVNPDALTVDGFEEAFIGMARQFTKVMALYDYEKCVDILRKRDGMSYEEAEEYMEFKVLGAWAGEHTPVFITCFPDEGDPQHRDLLCERMRPLSGGDPRDTRV